MKEGAGKRCRQREAKTTAAAAAAAIANDEGEKEELKWKMTEVLAFLTHFSF